MSQNFDIGLSFHFMPKNGKIFIIFYDYFSIFHKIKTRTYIQILRHGSLQMNVFIRHVEFHTCKTIFEGDILDQKIKVKKLIFKFPTASILSFLTNLYMIYTSK